MKKLLALIISVAMLFSMNIVVYAETTYIPGTYTASEAGFGGSVTVTITVDETEITAVTIEGSNETPALGGIAVATMPDQIMEAQSPQVDGVSGATLTSTAVRTAVEICLKQARGEISLSDEEERNYNADVIVIGGGVAGLSAAAAAGEAGASVIVLEAAAKTGGAGNLTGGHVAIINQDWNAVMDRNDTEVEKFLSYDEEKYPGPWGEALAVLKEQVTEYLDSDTPGRFDSLEKMLVEHYSQAYGTDRDGVPAVVDYDLCVAAFSHSMDIFNWVSTANYELTGNEYHDTRSTNPVKRGIGLTDSLLTLAESAGAEIHLNTRGVGLVTNETGEVTGVIAIDPKGHSVIYTANCGVVIASGGYAYNGDMVYKYQNRYDGITAQTHSSNIPTNVGDGIIMAMALGADTINMEFPITWRVAYAAGCTTVEYNSFFGTKQLVVNLDGKRFGDETTNKIVTPASDQKDGIYFLVGDKKMYEAMGEEKIRDYQRRGWLYTGDTLEEVAKEAGLDYNSLAETIETFNSYVENGEDPEFGRTNFNGKVEEGPYVITKMETCIHITSGGLRIDPEAHVIKTDGSYLGNVYAAGDAIGGIEGATHISGDALLSDIYYGRVAGENAYTGK